MSDPRPDPPVQDMFQKMPPASRESEQGVLGCILLDNRAALKAAEIISESDFFGVGHGLIFGTMLDMIDVGMPVDIVTLFEYLKKADRLERAGGAGYVGKLADMVPAAVHVESYAKIVRDKAIKRRIIAEAQTLAALAYEDKQDGDTLLSGASASISALSGEIGTRGHITIDEAIDATLLRVKEREESGVSGMSTGYNRLDYWTGGLLEKKLTILAGRPGWGKSALACNFARLVGAEHSVLFLSLEMDYESVIHRMVGAHAQVNTRDMQHGHMDEFKWDRVNSAADTLRTLNVVIDDSSSDKMTLDRIRMLSRRMADERKVKLIIVDYLQIVGIDHQRGRNREQEIAEISKGLKALAKELDVHVIALAQLSRDIEKREDKRPRLADLRESGAIEQDADIVLFVYRPQGNESRDLEVITAKNRTGSCGKTVLEFQEEFQLIREG